MGMLVDRLRVAWSVIGAWGVTVILRAWVRITSGNGFRLAGCRAVPALFNSSLQAWSSSTV